MQRVLSNGLWQEIKAHAKKAHRRKAAIAYVTRDLIGLKRGELLVMDASEGAVRSGETDAKLLRWLKRKGVFLHNCEDLHAKVLLLDDVAAIGSGNMSGSSLTGLVEAGLITDHASTVAGVASLNEQLVEQSEELTLQQIATLCKIKVVRRRGRTEGLRKCRTKVSVLGNRTWLVGVRELVREPPPDEQRAIDRAKQLLTKHLNNPAKDADWVR